MLSSSAVKFRVETKSDYFSTENAHREAFWNKFQPGADEHLFMRQLRHDPNFIPELCIVAVDGEEIVGNIAFTRSKIIQSSPDGSKELNTISFGPICVLPSYQGKGVGRLMIQHAFNAARELGHEAVVIYGDPRYYGRLGFRAGERYDIANYAGEYSIILLAIPLTPNHSVLADFGGGRFEEAPLFRNFTQDGLEEFDADFPAKEKQVTHSQTEFTVMQSLRYRKVASVL
jgi:predicted N-acetyltransferase YhbS